MAAFSALRARLTTAKGEVPPTAEAAAHVVLHRDHKIIARAQAVGDGAVARIVQSLEFPPEGAVISLELAGPLVPIKPKTYADVDMLVAPALEGVAIRVGDAVELMFPTTMRRTSLTPGQGLASLVGRVFNDPALTVAGNAQGEPYQLAKDRGAIFYRFSVTHLAQPTPDDPPTFLHRGGRIIAKSSLSLDGLRAWGTELAGAEVLDDPMRDGPETETGAMSRSLLAAFATLRWAHAAADPEALARAEFKLNFLQDRAASLGDAPPQPAGDPASTYTSAALGVLASIEGGGGPAKSAYAGLLARCRSRLSSAFDREKGFAPDLAPTERGVVVAALARLDRAGTEGPLPESAISRQALAALLNETTPTRAVAHWPWLGWAQLWIAGDGPVPGDTSLFEVRDLIAKHTLTRDDAGADNPDFVGGVVFTTGGARLPTAQSARPAAFLATMVGDRRLTTDAELPGRLLALIDVLRFLRQLTVDQSRGWALPARSLGGVRTAPWDDRVTPEATSMTLLAVAEAVAAVEGRSKVREEQAPSIPNQ